MPRMSPVDAAWLHMDDPTNLMIVTGLLTFDDPMDWHALRRLVHERLLDGFGPFHRIPVESRWPLLPPSWRDVEVDLDDHLVHVDLGGDAAGLERLVSDEMAVGLPTDRPLWRILMVDGVGDGSAVVARLHHCLADGVALAQVLLELTDEGPPEQPHRPRGLHAGPVQLPAADGATRARAAIRTAEVAERELLAFGAGQRLAEAYRAAREVLAVLRMLLFGAADPPTILKGPLGRGKKAVWTGRIPLAALKAAGARAGLTLNDVALSALAGALRHYLEEQGEDAPDLRAAVPVNLRGQQAPVSSELGNDFGLVLARLPVGLADPEARLRETAARMAALKRSPQALVTYVLLALIGRTPVPLEQVLLAFLGQKATAVVTNVPGPSQRLSLAGRPLTGVQFWVPQSGRLALGASIFSYAGEITAGIASDVGRVPDPERLLALWCDELRALGVEAAALA